MITLTTNTTNQSQQQVTAGVAALTTSVVVGLVLGLAAIAVDALDVNSQIARLVFIAASTGLSWGAAAVIMGRRAGNPWLAGINGVLCLIAAVIAYYAGIRIFGTRPNTSTDSLIVTARIWIAAAIIGGLPLGIAGWYTAHGKPVTGSLAWAGLGGGLASQGTFLLFNHLTSEGGRGSGLWFPVLALSIMALPIGFAVWAARHKHPFLTLAAAVAVAAVGGLAWSVILNQL